MMIDTVKGHITFMFKTHILVLFLCLGLWGTTVTAQTLNLAHTHSQIKETQRVLVSWADITGTHRMNILFPGAQDLVLEHSTCPDVVNGTGQCEFTVTPSSKDFSGTWQGAVLVDIETITMEWIDVSIRGTQNDLRLASLQTYKREEDLERDRDIYQRHLDAFTITAVERNPLHLMTESRQIIEILVANRTQADLSLPEWTLLLTREGSNERAFNLLGDTCMARVIESGDSCSIFIRFEPSKPGTYHVKVVARPFPPFFRQGGGGENINNIPQEGMFRHNYESAGFLTPLDIIIGEYSAFAY